MPINMSTIPVPRMLATGFGDGRDRMQKCMEPPLFRRHTEESTDDRQYT